MKNLIILATIMFSVNAKAALTVNCQTNDGRITSKLTFKKNMVQVQVGKFKALVYSNSGIATYSEKWNSVTVDATLVTETEQKGVKFYFASARSENKTASIRPYGSTTQELFPGSEGIVVSGLTCDQSYNAVLKEVLD